MVNYKITNLPTFHRQARFQEFLSTLSYSEMPSKIPTYSVYPNNSPDTDYEQDYETPAPGPPPTRSGHQNLDEDKDKIPNSLSRIRLARVLQFIFFLQTSWSWNGHSPSEPSSSLHSSSLWLPVQVTCCICTSVHLILERSFFNILGAQT